MTHRSGDSALLQTQQLCKRFGGLAAVDNLSFEVFEGEIRGVIGPNGAGKTTLFNVITGHLKPTSGRVVFCGEDITRRSPHLVARCGIARKFQITQVFGAQSVFDNVALAAQRTVCGSTWRLFGRCSIRDRAMEILGRVHLEEKADWPARSLSHGEQQCLELGIVLATGAKLLLLDEPTAGMSLEERAEMGELLKDIALDTTIVVTEHDFDFIKDVAETITVMNKGAKLAEGSVEEVECNQDVVDCYLGGEVAQRTRD
jgi:ABC-type branched-subunit amino acid transport system ATPase component